MDETEEKLEKLYQIVKGENIIIRMMEGKDTEETLFLLRMMNNLATIVIREM